MNYQLCILCSVMNFVIILLVCEVIHSLWDIDIFNWISIPGVTVIAELSYMKHIRRALRYPESPVLAHRTEAETPPPSYDEVTLAEAGYSSEIQPAEEQSSQSHSVRLAEMADQQGIQSSFD